jgi:hypothetical protein
VADSGDGTVRNPKGDMVNAHRPEDRGEKLRQIRDRRDRCCSSPSRPHRGQQVPLILAVESRVDPTSQNGIPVRRQKGPRPKLLTDGADYSEGAHPSGSRSKAKMSR